MEIIEHENNGRIEIERRWECHCGAKVVSFAGYDVDCEACGQMFNGYGQQLADPAQWEEQW